MVNWSTNYTLILFQFSNPSQGDHHFYFLGVRFIIWPIKIVSTIVSFENPPIVNVSKQTCDITYISDVLTLSNSPFVIIFAWRKGVAIFFSINSWNYILVFFLTFSKKILLTYLDVDELDVSPLRKRRQPS